MKEIKTLKDKIAEKIKELRNEKGINQHDLAAALKIDRSTIAKYETGVAVPSVYILVALTEFFDVTADCILGLDE